MFDENATTPRTLRNIKKSMSDSIERKYGINDEVTINSLLKLQGLAKENFDFVNMATTVLNNRINDVSIDDNANKNEKTVEGIQQETFTSMKKAMGFDYLYRQMMEMYGKPEAKRLTGEIYDYSLGLSDSTQILKNYSYYEHTPIFVRINGKVESTTLKKIFERFSFFSKELEDMSEIKTKDIEPEVRVCRAIIRKEVQKNIFSEPVSGIKENIKIEVWDNTCWVNISRIIKHKRDDNMIIYQTECGDYAFVTSNHPVFLADKTEKLAGELVVGDEVLKNETIPLFDEYINVSTDLAYLLGFICGDGNIHSYEQDSEYINNPFGHIKFTRGGNLVSIYQKDIDNAKIVSIVKKVFPDANLWKFTANSDMQINFTSQWLNRVCSEYFGFGYKENSFTKTLPKNIFNWNRTSKNAFICGLIDSDGTVFKAQGRVDIRLRSYAVITGLYDLLRNVGANGVRKRITNETMFGVAFRPNEEMVLFSEKIQKLDQKILQSCITYGEQHNTESKSNKIKKIITDIPECFNSYMDFVYDITTDSGSFYANGMVQHNCYAIDATRIITEGRPFGQLQSKPAKRLSSYISALCETIHQMSHHLAGACAISTFFSDLGYLALYREKFLLSDLSNPAVRKIIENELQQFVHSVNHLSRASDESPFTNLSLLDRIKIKKDIKEKDWLFTKEELEKITDVEYTENEYLDYITEYVMELQNIFLDFFDKGDPMRNGLQYRFPVVTLCLSKKKTNANWIVEDNLFLDNVCNRDIFRYNIFASEGDKRANCCFDKDQKIAVFSSKKGIIFDTFENIFKIKREDTNDIKIMHNGSWRYFKRVMVDYKRDYYKIKTSNNKEIVITEEHLNPTIRGDVKSSELTTEDYLLFNTRSMSGNIDHDKGLTYEQGYMVGLFAGDGSYISKNNEEEVKLTGINYSLNNNCIYEIKPIIDYGMKQLECSSESYFGKVQNNVYSLMINDANVALFINSWVNGNRSYNKSINMNCLLQSINFRKGIMDGWYASDGGNSNRCYSVSKELIDSMELICTSLGMNTVIDCSDRTGEGNVIIRGEEYNRNYPLYCLRWYKHDCKRNFQEIYKIFNNSIFFKIKSIEKVKASSIAYCVELSQGDEVEPYFTLPNGIITHNCRLISNSEMLGLASQVNSFGAGGSSSIGSHRVCTVNFVRLILEAKDEADFFSLLEHRIESSAKILKAHKELLKALTEKGLQMFIKMGWIRMDRLFSTVGIIGVYECATLFKERFGNNRDVEGIILSFLNKKVEEMGVKYDIICNIEQIPGESFAVRFAEADRILFGDDKIPFPLYSNQFIPQWLKVSAFERLEMDGKYNQLLTGGGIVHITIGEKVTPSQAKNLIIKAVECGCEHFALNAIFSECKEKHISFGEPSQCPVCGSEIMDKYTRISGYFVPVSSWNKMRREWDFPNRYREIFTH